MAKQYVRQHHALAETGKPSQEDSDEYVGKEPAPTEFAENAKDTSESLHSTEKGLDRG